ncbi:EamA family transporter RarD [Qipengyuania sp. 1NDW9]|uniref:EamA family transporter RarD n=1 Tax=Qipengyuania aquimaris TaxID=255984 RepID=A0A9Q3S1B7_9SPHN|nr:MULTISPECIES: EamA family transporter RarD [Qipengyuania]MBX7492577.1 EamA family transporter RarD [Qipengyuania xiapuensis]MBY6218251.1 EamA family transporter RarD [Qipengyuania aquimaris]
MGTTETEHPKTGLWAALGAYVIWGFLPLYLILVREVPAFEFVGWRIIWTLPLCLLIVAFRKQLPQLRAALTNPRTMGWLLLSSALIAVNWVVYVWSIQNNYVYAASLGYYINPLLNVLLGTLLLKERLSRFQWAAVAIAAFGVSLLLGGALTTLWISLTLAMSFGAYGVIRKQVDVGALPGLTIESMILLIPAAGVAWYFAQSAAGSSFTQSLDLSLAIMLGGALTAVPLLLFAIAARLLPYSTLGFIQFLAPSIVFLLGLTVFGEELKPVQAACFACIWLAASVFVWDLWSRSRKPVAS